MTITRAIRIRSHLSTLISELLTLYSEPDVTIMVDTIFRIISEAYAYGKEIDYTVSFKEVFGLILDGYRYSGGIDDEAEKVLMRLMTLYLRVVKQVSIEFQDMLSVGTVDIVSVKPNTILINRSIIDKLKA